MFQLPILPHPGPVSSSFIRPQTSDGSDPHVLRSPHVCHQSTVNLAQCYVVWWYVRTHRQTGRAECWHRLADWRINYVDSLTGRHQDEHLQGATAAAVVGET